jgi:hypothetical protein
VFPYVEALPPDQAALLWQATRAFESAAADGDIIFQGKCSPATARSGFLRTVEIAGLPVSIDNDWQVVRISSLESMALLGTVN